ncbi:MAG: AraC family transcriptional regulator [Bacteroidota bacterium]
MKIFIYLLLFFNTYSVVSQNSVLKNKDFVNLQDKVRILTSSNVDSAFIVAERIEQSDNYIHKAFAKGVKSYLYQLKGQSSKAAINYKEAFEYISKAPASVEKTKNTAYLFNYGGVSDMQKGDFSKALEKCQQGEKLSKEVNDVVQLAKFKANIAKINAEIKNYNIAIKKTQEADRLLDKNRSLYSSEQFLLNKSNYYINLGYYYEASFKNKNGINTVLIDSALHFYKKAILFSQNITDNKILAQNNIANIYYQQGKFKEAEKIYQNVITEAKEKENKKVYALALYNLGDLYFYFKKYDMSLVYLKKFDSIHNLSNVNAASFCLSNYYQSKIYEQKKDYDNSIKFADLYIENVLKNEENLNKESQVINYKQNSNELKKEMIGMKAKYATQVYLKKGSLFFLIILLIILISFLIKNIKTRREMQSKFNLIIEEYRKQPISISENDSDFKEEAFQKEISSNTSLSIDEEKETEIIFKLKHLEDKLVFLNENFTLSFVAKKIKTNTTYLSYVVNKRFNKSFSEYANELKINYAINELVNNPIYRKYSTQAIAESVGFKKANSFAKSFSKRTGLTPTQFAKKLDEFE